MLSLNKASLKLNKYIIIGIIIFIACIVMMSLNLAKIASKRDTISMFAESYSYEPTSKQEKGKLSRILKPYSVIGIKHDGFFKNEQNFAFNIDIKYVDRSYFYIVDTKLTSGRIISGADFRLGGSVISESLAFKLFKDLDCIGSRFEYLGKSYYVTGIAENVPISLATGEYTAYFPAETGVNIDYLGIVGIARPTNPIAADDLYSMYNEKFGNVVGYDMIEEKHKLYILVKVMLLIPLIILIVLVVRFTNSVMRKNIKDIKKKLEDKYLKNIILSVLLRGFMILAMYCLVIASIVFMYNSMVTSIMVLRQYVPSPLIDLDEIEKIIRQISMDANNPFPYIPLDVRIIMQSINRTIIGFVGILVSLIFVLLGIIRNMSKTVPK